jgi:pyroglutamyl-peptidase
MTTENKDDQPEPAKVMLTAFGPFQGVPDNPSMALLSELPSVLDQGWKAEVKERILKTLVIETSAEGAQEGIQQLEECLQQNSSSQGPVVCLHLGVNRSADGFHIEACAYNDASFSIPDERQYRPNGEKILKDAAWGTANRSLYNTDELVDQLSISFPAIESKVSTDPGRFVCNYLYYTSLSKLQGRLAEASLFLHIPPFDKIPKEIQLEYLAEVLRVLCQVELK